MDDGDLSFDFEGGLDAGPTNPQAPAPGSIFRPDFAGTAAGGATNYGVMPSGPDPAAGNYGGRRSSYRQTVCRHWLRGLCMKGDACGFLHQFDKSRMPICRFFRQFGECREQDCVYKHTNEDIKECNMYKLGFCPNGPSCRYRHIKQPGPPPPVEEVLQRLQQMNANRFYQNRNAYYPQQAERPQFSQGPYGAYQDTTAKSAVTESPNMQQHGQEYQQQAGQMQVQNFPNAQQNQGNRTAIALPQGSSRDCQELEPSIGEQLAALLYLEPDGELMAVSIAAEKKREEEKAKGVDPENGTENPDIVPFEDNEEDDEEESEEEEDEEESYDQAVAGRGRGRGMRWPPHMPFARGANPGPQMHGFPPLVMGALGPNGFPMPGHFGMGPGPFAPFVPRFPGDLAGPAPGMMFHGRPPPGGFGMMMGPGRAPFVGAPARSGRPVGMPPMLPPPSQSSQSVKRTQRGTANDGYSGGTDQGKNQAMNGSGADNETQDEQRVKPQVVENFGSRSSFRNGDSESEDEAPRRSRHG